LCSKRKEILTKSQLEKALAQKEEFPKSEMEEIQRADVENAGGSFAKHQTCSVNEKICILAVHYSMLIIK